MTDANPTDSLSRAQFAKEASRDGDFVRQQSAFRRLVEARDDAEFPAAAGRYQRHYYVTHRKINPTGVVPLGPELDFPHA
ncbi:MAG: hypothetical protein AAF628_20105 [Planctomycetota bacterium]